MYYFSKEWFSILLLILLTSLYFYVLRVRKQFNYWKNLGISGPKPYLFFGNLLSLRKQIHIVKLEWMKKYGKIYGIYYGLKPVLMISDPELIKKILIKDFGTFRNKTKGQVTHPIFGLNLGELRDDKWKRVRNIVNPSFTSGKLKSMYSMITDKVNELLDILETDSINGNEINSKKMFTNFTLNVFLKSAFGLSVNTYTDTENSFLKNAQNLTDISIGNVISMSVLPKFILWLLNIKADTPAKPVEYLANAMKVIINERKESKYDYKDLLQLLINAEFNEQLTDETDKNESHLINQNTNDMDTNRKELKFIKGCNKLTETEIIAQAMIFNTAGFETTASALTNCSFELALNQEIQQKLYQEIKSVVNTDGNIAYDVLMKLPYLDAVICETLRKYPSAISMRREAGVEYELEEYNITLPKHQAVEIATYAVHHCEEFFPNPEQFIPERFLTENLHKIIPCSYLPFGLGPRNCVGMRFGLMEVKLCLALSILKYRFMKSDKTDNISFKDNFRALFADKTFVRIQKRLNN